MTLDFYGGMVVQVAARPNSPIAHQSIRKFLRENKFIKNFILKFHSIFSVWAYVIWSGDSENMNRFSGGKVCASCRSSKLAYCPPKHKEILRGKINL
jgi:hypothetical protein